MNYLKQHWIVILIALGVAYWLWNAYGPTTSSNTLTTDTSGS